MAAYAREGPHRPPFGKHPDVHCGRGRESDYTSPSTRAELRRLRGSVLGKSDNNTVNASLYFMRDANVYVDLVDAIILCKLWWLYSFMLLVFLLLLFVLAGAVPLI